MFNKTKIYPFSIPVAEVFAKGISFVNILLLIRVITIFEYADYSYLISIILWASVLMDGGINDLIYNQSLNKNKIDFNGLFTGKIMLTIGVILGLGLYFYAFDNKLIVSGMILSFVIAITSLTSMLKMYARGNQFVHNDLFAIVTEPLIRFLFLGSILLIPSDKKWGFNQILFGFFIAGIISYGINYFLLLKKHPFKIDFHFIKTPFKNLKSLLFDTRYFLLYYLMLIGLQRIDIIFLEEFSSKQNLALFSSAITVYQVVYLFFYAFITSRILSIIEKEALFFKYFFMIGISIVIITFLVSPVFYRVFFPEAYHEGYRVLNFLMISIIPTIFSLFFIIRNNYQGNVKINFYFIGIILIVKLLVYLVIKPFTLPVYYTVYGVSELLLLLLFLYYSKFYESSPNQ